MTERRRRSLVEEREQTLAGRIAMAAADAAVESVSLINEALEVSELPHAALAERLGVTPGRVSQVVNGDGNVRITTLARFLRALGYNLTLRAVPASKAAKPLPSPYQRPGRQQRIGGHDIYTMVTQVTCITEDGVGQEPVVVASRAHPAHWLESPAFSLQPQVTGQLRSRETRFEVVKEDAVA